MTMKKAVLQALGFVALGFGGVGIFIPLLPTTPFVICAAACFSIANPGLYRKLEKSRYFGEYIRNYREKTGISRRARVRGLAFLWITLAISAIIFRRPLVWIILAVVGVAVSIHLLMLRASSKS
jgi:uncharacterized membrane protein YbaN (DUF454 family)